MNYFRLLQANIDPKPFLEEIDGFPEAWDLDTSRQKNTKVQSETNAIFLRKRVHRPDLHGDENQETVLTKVATRFPRALAFMDAVARAHNAELSRATIVRLKPQSQVYRHIDTGSYYLIRDRYHFVLRSAQGSPLRSGDEQISMREGELWWFNNKQHHEAFNESDEWRVHYIFDLLPAAYKPLAINAIEPPTSVKVFTRNEEQA